MANVWANIENVDLDFIYSDADSHENEIAELYAYSEEQDILNNRTAFEEIMGSHGLPIAWFKMSPRERNRAWEILMDGFEVSEDGIRWRHIQAVYYLLQGVFGECDSIDQQAKNARANVFDCYRKGFFPLLVQQLVWAMEATQIMPQPPQQQSNNGNPNNNPNRKQVSLADSFKLRVITGMVYTIVEVMRANCESDTDEELILRKTFAEELSQPMAETNDQLLAIILFHMVSRFANNSAPSFPIKKILLLLWKVILITLGGSSHLKYLKNLYRTEAGLPPEPDDTLEIVRNMRASSPPMNANEALEAQSQRKLNKPLKRQMFVKQSSVAGDEGGNGNGGNGGNGNGGGELDANDDDLIPDDGLGSSEGESDSDIDKVASSGSSSVAETDVDEAPSLIGEETSEEEKVDMGGRPASPRPETPNRGSLARLDLEDDGASNSIESNKRLPWIPKVRNKDIDSFFDYSRNKFIGFLLPNDRTTTAGLPAPILESIDILKNHVYVSLTEVQSKREDELQRFPLTMKEEGLASLTSPAEALYCAMLPNLSQFVISVLKILLAAAPTSRTKAESINIVSDVLPAELPSSPVQSMKLSIDVNRHKEIIIKAISGILLLLLKHLKINHIYQFEYISQQLMFANCIPLVLKFFNQNIVQYVSSKNTISVIDFPACVIGDPPELSAENLDMGDPSTPLYCWRNVYSCINLLRILNKLTKWKHSRIMMLVVFKSAPILKRALKLRHAMLQLYVLKLLKMQAKYLGRQWRKSNMKTMSAIYQKVRHRITDDWAYGNDIDSRPWDFQAEEFALQASINRFHQRRYGKIGGVDPSHPDAIADLDLLDSVDNNILSVLSKETPLPRDFKVNYEKWLQREVFDTQTNWDLLLSETNTSATT